MFHKSIKGPLANYPGILGAVPIDGFVLTGKLADAQMTNIQNKDVTLRRVTNTSGASGTITVEWAISGNQETITIDTLLSEEGLWNKVISSTITDSDLWGYV